MDEAVVNKLEEIIVNQGEIINSLADVNYTLQYQSNQFHILLVGLLLAFVSYFLYRTLKNFI
ncbi:hypothetical protein QBE52_04880 [Clostridiaceae bacterium 35-E11]